LGSFSAEKAEKRGFGRCVALLLARGCERSNFPAVMLAKSTRRTEKSGHVGGESVVIAALAVLFVQFQGRSPLCRCVRATGFTKKTARPDRGGRQPKN
jgi:hypothetical protein